MIAAYCQKQIFAPFTIKGICSLAVFETWLEKCLIPTLADWCTNPLPKLSLKTLKLTTIAIKVFINKEQLANQILMIAPISGDRLSTIENKQNVALGSSQINEPQQLKFQKLQKVN
jgi:hypothetical protein